MRLSDVFSAQAVAAQFTSDPSNAEAYLGEQFFPAKKKMGIDLKWLKTHQGVGVALKPSSFDSLATIRPRGGFKAFTEQMPLFRESMVISEQDIAEIMRAQDSNDPYLNDVLGHLYDDANELIEGANISAERMRMALLAPADGNVEIKVGMADNAQYTYDYDPDGAWKASNYLAITGTDCWNNADTAKPLNDIQTACDALTDLGAIPTYAVMNQTTFNYLMASEQIQKFNATQYYGIETGFLDRDTVKRIFNAQTGLTILVYNKKYKDYDGTTYKFFPDGYVTIVGSDLLGSTWYGVTPEERTLMGDNKVDVSVLDTGVAIAVKTDYGPPVMYSTTASQIAMPSFEGMDTIYELKVVE